MNHEIYNIVVDHADDDGDDNDDRNHLNSISKRQGHALSYLCMKWGTYLPILQRRVTAV